MPSRDFSNSLGSRQLLRAVRRSPNPSASRRQITSTGEKFQSEGYGADQAATDAMEVSVCSLSNRSVSYYLVLVFQIITFAMPTKIVPEWTAGCQPSHRRSPLTFAQPTNGLEHQHTGHRLGVHERPVAKNVMAETPGDVPHDHQPSECIAKRPNIVELSVN